MPDTPVPVNFVDPHFERDLRRFVPQDQWRPLMVDIVNRLGAFPRMGVELEAPNQGFRCHGMGEWQLYYEVLDEADGEPSGVDVYRVVPEAFSRINVFGP